MDLALLAGTTSTVLFASASLPMLAKAIRTHDVRSYSLVALIVSNTANAIHTIYVASLPAGPIWVLHGFYLVTEALMIVFYLRQARSASVHRRSRADRPGSHRGGRAANPDPACV
ncbi:hypothetical protein GCM10017608_31040 [Agromyces luteolus]|uniref:PQ-loop repeat-containing protein n=1 Tax=Agromyces luteolus TaxID=88373 RepID=A0A7C9LYW7_9MICO|nr:hypothetical protein [Agromyces luteolus]MUN07817.1 hypothetical protein [Agromyces luteolus]GLK29168.1 hypothetical protein GCM10017608_31040 [Agromyces luteolus]